MCDEIYKTWKQQKNLFSKNLSYRFLLLISDRYKVYLELSINVCSGLYVKKTQKRFLEFSWPLLAHSSCLNNCFLFIKLTISSHLVIIRIKLRQIWNYRILLFQIKQ